MQLSHAFMSVWQTFHLITHSVPSGLLQTIGLQFLCLFISGMCHFHFCFILSLPSLRFTGYFVAPFISSNYLWFQHCLDSSMYGWLLHCHNNSSQALSEARWKVTLSRFHCCVLFLPMLWPLHYIWFACLF